MSVEMRLEGPVMVVGLRRRERRNAVDRPTARALAAAFRDFEAEPAARVAVLHGGDCFCAGADLKAVAAGPDANELSEQGDGPMGPTRRTLSKPVIAAIEGHAVAGGLELALWCDLRVAAEDARLGVFCRRVGVPLIDGGTVRLPRLVGMGRALDLILTGREVSAAEALDMGLVNRVCAAGGALEAALALARQLAALPQQCLLSDRASAYEQWSMDLQAAMGNEFRRGLALIGRPEMLRGLRRFADGEGRHGEPLSGSGGDTT